MVSEDRHPMYLAGHPQPFLVTQFYCSNPDCSCRVVYFTFKEVEEDGTPVAGGISFSADVDVDTWEITGLGSEVNRAEEYARIARAYIDQLSEGMRAEHRKRLEYPRWVRQQVQQYQMDRADVEAGKLVAFSDILSGNDGLYSGGITCSYEFAHAGQEYLVEDLYCPQPSCDCREVCLLFFRTVADRRGVKEIHEEFMGVVKFDGTTKVRKARPGKRPVARQVLAAFWDEYRDDLALLNQRYQYVKSIGKRILEQRPARRPARANSAAKRKRRNRPCPCGSGKRYAKCCGRK